MLNFVCPTVHEAEKADMSDRVVVGDGDLASLSGTLSLLASQNNQILNALKSLTASVDSIHKLAKILLTSESQSNVSAAFNRVLVTNATVCSSPCAFQAAKELTRGFPSASSSAAAAGEDEDGEESGDDDKPLAALKRTKSLSQQVTCLSDVLVSGLDLAFSVHV